MKIDCRHECIFNNAYCENKYTCTEFKKINSYLTESNIPKEYTVKKTLSVSNRNDVDTFKALQLAAVNISYHVDQGDNFYICSVTPGNGKTTWATKLMINYFLKRGNFAVESVVGMFVSTSDMLATLADKSFSSSDANKYYRHKLETAELLILDDLITERRYNGDELTILKTIVENRLGAGLPTIYTCNVVDREMLNNELGPQIASRILETATIYEITSTKDMRN